MLGFCAGGTTALILTANYPEAVEKLIVWGCKAYFTQRDRENALEIFSRNWIGEKGIRGIVSAVYGETEFNKLRNEFLKVIPSLDDICTKDLPKIQCPTLIMHGEKDDLVTKEHPLYLLKHIKNAELHCFPTGRHNIQQEFTKEFYEKIEQFLI